MSKVQDVQEVLHWPIYDCFFVPGRNGNGQARKFHEVMTDSRMIRFFVDVQNKTRLETNLQASGVLPSRNQFEARAMRVVVSSNHRFREEPPAPGPALSEAELIDQVIHNSVTTLIVGEKVMIEMPTFYFPGGSGVTTSASNVSGHGAPDPMATFRFAEPVRIDPQQNFRVELLFPQGVPGQAANPADPRGLAGAEGPIRIWVVIDGYMTRDVQ
jgi:hypothetical protein